MNAQHDTLPLPAFADVEAAAGRLAGIVRRTPLLAATPLDEALGGRILLKVESLQRTGSFKFRGAYNRLVQLDAGAAPRRRRRLLVRQPRPGRRCGGEDARHPGDHRDAGERAAP